MNLLATNETSQANRSALPEKRNCANGNKSWFKPGVSQTTTHGQSRTLTYKIWTGMKSRCFTPSATGYENYGGRGISVCGRWMNFENFLSDMGECPEGMSIDRKNSDANYSPDNCRWATRKEQNRNQRRLMYLTLGGKTQCASAWADEVGMQVSSLVGRIKRGWPVDKALNTPIRSHKEYSNARA